MRREDVEARRVQRIHRSLMDPTPRLSDALRTQRRIEYSSSTSVSLTYGERTR